MKKFIAALFASFMLIGLFSAAAAAHHNDAHDKGPGPNGSNNKGLCTAYFNGQKNGHDKHGSPGPFAALEDEADEANGDDENNEDARLEAAEDVFEYCQEFGIGGNPWENGRFACVFDDGGTPEDTSDDTYTCTENEGPGNS